MRTKLKRKLKFFSDWLTKPQFRGHQRWLKNGQDSDLLLRFDLNQDSFVVDGGAYLGTWTEQILHRYNCTIAAYEPVQDFFEQLEHKFRNIDNVILHMSGLSSKQQVTEIFIGKDASSTISQVGPKEQITLVDVNGIFSEQKQIDLIKLNIEGAEYDVIDRLIESGNIANVRNLLVQFHTFPPDYKRRYNSVSKRLSATHQKCWSYPYVWEHWEINPSKAV